MKRRDFLSSSVASAGLLTLGGLGAARAQSTSLPAWVSALPLWQWYAIPGTALSSVQPSPIPIGNTGPASKIDAWCGATLKRAGSVYMLGAAGGHADYAGNEVNALQLNAATPRWVQLRAPSAPADVIGNEVQYYLDRRPAATHTYNATQFIDSQNRMVVMPSPGLGGLGATPPSGWPYTGAKRIYSFSVGAGDWEHPDTLALFPGDGDFTGCLCVKHPVTEDIYYSRNYGDGWWRYRPSNNTWTKLSGATRAPWYAGAAIDPTRNRMLIVGGYNADAPEVRDLNGNSISVSFAGQGASALARNEHPGVVWDEVNGNFLVFFNNGSTLGVRRVNAATWSVDTPAMTGTLPVRRTNGVHNAVQYVPELGGVVIANTYGGNVQFMRTSSAGATAPTTDTTPPSAPAGLRVS
jgi:hypothetical protein